MMPRALRRPLLLLHRLGLRFDRVLHDEYRVPLVCRLGFHEPGFFVNGAAACVRCRMEQQLAVR